MTILAVEPQVFTRETVLALRTVELRLTRDGEQTGAPKVALLLNRALQISAVFVGSYSITQRFAASAVDAGWLVLALDETPAARAGARYVLIDSDITIAIDLNDGSGGGGGGMAAALGAMVRVDGLPAAREVVALDRAVDGVWRVAGSGVTDAGGAVQLDLQVTPSGRVYAVAPDDYGTPFQAGLGVVVGQRIRPSVYAGWLYQVTEAGELPASEPLWWAAEGDNASRPLGTARAIAVRYYRPLAHGPIPVEVI